MDFVTIAFRNLFSLSRSPFLSFAQIYRRSLSINFTHGFNLAKEENKEEIWK